MEAKEFMLNDLVYRKEHLEFHKPVPRSVVKIDGVMDNDMITFAPYSEFLDMDEIEPIPWTVDYAKGNGLVDCGDDIYQDDKRQWGVDFRKHEFYTFDEEVENTIKPILFYHELQHALRLVGLNEVADNLKVE